MAENMEVDENNEKETENLQISKNTVEKTDEMLLSSEENALSIEKDNISEENASESIKTDNEEKAAKPDVILQIDIQTDEEPKNLDKTESSSIEANLPSDENKIDVSENVQKCSAENTQSTAPNIDKSDGE